MRSTMDDLPQRHSQSTDNFLRSMSEQFENIQQSRLQELGDDIKRLHSEKLRLQQEIDIMLQQKDLLANQQQQLINNWVENMATQLQEELLFHISQKLTESLPSATRITEYGDNAQKLLTSFDETLRSAFLALKQDLYSYQNALSQQLYDMHTLEQQGEAIISALIQRLNSLPLEKVAPRSIESPLYNPPSNNNNSQSYPPYPEDIKSMSMEIINNDVEEFGRNGKVQDTKYVESAITPIATIEDFNHYSDEDVITPPPIIKPKITPRKKSVIITNDSESTLGKDFIKPFQNQIGLGLMIISVLALALHDIVIKIISVKSNFLGTPVGGFINMMVGNSLLMIWLRMIVVLPLISLINMMIYPDLWKDINKFFFGQDNSPWKSLFKAITSSIVISGLFLFLFQLFLYLSLGKIGNPGIGLTIVFIYPMISIPLTWWLFGQKPNLLKLGVVANIILGVILTASPIIEGNGKMSLFGLISALGAGVSFAFYLIFTQKGLLKKWHSITVSLIQFFTVFILTSISLMLPLPNTLTPQVLSNQWMGLLTGVFILGILAIVSYLSNYFGSKFMGNGKENSITSLYPVITVILAYLLIPGRPTNLTIFQIIGVALVTFGMTIMNFNRMINRQ